MRTYVVFLEGGKEQRIQADFAREVGGAVRFYVDSGQERRQVAEFKKHLGWREESDTSNKTKPNP